MNTDDLNERCDNEYCGICGPVHDDPDWCFCSFDYGIGDIDD